MNIYILLAIFITYFIATYILLKKDLLQPAVIFSAVYIVCILSTIYNIKKWNVNIQLNTLLILALGALEFIVISIIINKYYFNKNKEKKSNEVIEKNEKKFNIDLWKVIVVCVYDIVILAIYIYNVISIANQFGGFNTISEALGIFKEHTSYNLDVQLPQIIGILQKPVIIFAYIFAYAFIKIIFDSEKKYLAIIKNSYYLIPIIAYVIQEYMSSNRLSILSLMIGIGVMILILWNKKHNWTKTIKIKYIIFICLIVLIGLVAFYYSAKFVGRKNSNGLLEYITLYCGGSIECLNQYIQDPIPRSDIIGKESFYYLVKNLYSYGFLELEEFYPIHLEFRDYDGTMIGNVYTAYRRWIQDFGIIGMITLQAIMAVFYNIFYNKIKFSKKENSDFSIIMYAYMAYPLFLHPIDGYLYLLTVRLAFITTFVMFLAIYIFLFKNPIEIINKLKIKITEIRKNKK